MNISKFNKAVNEILDHDFDIYFADETLDEQVISSFGSEIECKFPEDFTVFTRSRLNGFLAEAKEDVWPRRKGGPYWIFQYGLMVYGLDAGLPEWINLRFETQKFRERTESNLVPAMKTVSSADPYCFNREGDLVIWNHETFEAGKTDKSFYEAFIEELKLLKSNKERAKKEFS